MVATQNFTFNNFRFSGPPAEELNDGKSSVSPMMVVAATLMTAVLGAAPVVSLPANNRNDTTLTATSNPQPPTTRFIQEYNNSYHHSPAPTTKVEQGNTTAAFARAVQDDVKGRVELAKNVQRELQQFTGPNASKGAQPAGPAVTPVMNAVSSSPAAMGQGTAAMVATGALMRNSESFSSGPRGRTTEAKVESSFRSTGPSITEQQAAAPVSGPQQSVFDKLSRGPGFGPDPRQEVVSRSEIASQSLDGAMKFGMSPTALADLSRSVKQFEKDAGIAGGLANNALKQDEKLTAAIVAVGAPRPESTNKTFGVQG